MIWWARINRNWFPTCQTLVLILVLIFGLLVIAIVVSDDVNAATWYVDDSGDANFTNIQNAIDHSDHGDIIRVYNGTYYENLNVYKSVSIIGNGSSLSIIDGGGIGNVVKLTMDSININGLMIRNSGNQIHHAGIKIESTHNIISNNFLINNSWGIWLFNSRMNMIKNNTCSNNSNAGIGLESSYNNILSNNTCINNWLHGIYLYQSSENHIDNSTYSNNQKHGIIIDSSVSNTFINNIINNNIENGINLLMNSKDNTISNINCSSNSIGINLLSDSNNNTMNNITCSNNREHGIALVSSNLNIINNSTFNNNKKIGIHLQSSSKYNIIRNNTCLSNLHGINIEHSSSNTIEKNNCSNNREHGISVFRSTYNSIMGNIFKNNIEHGINLINNSHHNNITSNNCSINLNGIYLDKSDNNIISSNICKNNIENGLFLQESKFNDVSTNNLSENNNGININLATVNKINNCKLLYNTNGTILNSSYQNSISNSTFYKNKLDGIVLINSDTNQINNVTSNNNTISSIGLINSFSNSIVNTTCSNSKYGIYIDATFRIQMFSQYNFIKYNVIRNNEVGIYYIGPQTILKLVNNNTFNNNEIKYYNKLQEGTDTNVDDNRNTNGYDLYPFTIQYLGITVFFGIIITLVLFRNSFTTVEIQTKEDDVKKFISFKKSNYGNAIVVSKILEIIKKFFPEKIGNKNIINYMDNSLLNVSNDININYSHGHNNIELYDKLLMNQINKQVTKLKINYNEKENRKKEEEQWNFYLSLIEKPIEFGVSNIILADDSIEDISCEIVNGKIFNVISYINNNCKENDNYIQLIVFGIYQHLYNYYSNGLENIDNTQYPLQFRKKNPYEFILYAISSICTIYSLKDITKNIIKDSMMIKIEINIKLTQLDLIAKGYTIDTIYNKIMNKIQYYIDKHMEEISLLHENKNEYNSKYFDSQIEKMQVVVGYLEQKKITINSRFEKRKIRKDKKLYNKLKSKIPSENQMHEKNQIIEPPSFKEINDLLEIPNDINRNVLKNIQWYQRNAEKNEFFHNT